MLIPQQLRQAREEAGLSQAQLAARTGLSRNQIVRAETGQNITLETLQKIVTHLPIDELNLMERVKIRMDYLNPAETMFFGIAETLASLIDATQKALKLAVASRGILALARVAEAEQLGEERPDPDVATEILLQNVEASLQKIETMRDAMFRAGAKPAEEAPRAQASGSSSSPEDAADQAETAGQRAEGPMTEPL